METAALYDYALEYLGSWPGIAVLTLTCVGLGLKAYDVFAKLWPATTGKYVTEGWITWSEFESPEIALLKQATTRSSAGGLISYAYRVNGGQHNGTIPTEKLTQKEVDEKLYKGAKVAVYYSPRRPDYSHARKPPGQSLLAGDVCGKWFVIPVLVLNLLSFFIWFLVNA